jgi:N-acetylglucosaminyldiphosphoundecaprenol N-acetyl-beta-D-mannosaminyltransferase
MSRIRIFDYPVDCTTLDETTDWAMAQQDRRRPQTIAVLNANKLWLAERDASLRDYLMNASLVLPEYAVVWAARQVQRVSLQPVYGVTFTKTFLSKAQASGSRPFFLGGSPHVSQLLKDNLNRDFPKLDIAGIYHGYIEASAEASMVEMIRRSKADILFVGMGSPRQENWIAKNKDQLSVPVMIGVGGSFDVLAGLKSDTPARVRGSGWEWLYRLYHHPQHYWKRYLLSNSWLLWKVIAYKLRMTKYPGDGILKG